MAEVAEDVHLGWGGLWGGGLRRGEIGGVREGRGGCYLAVNSLGVDFLVEDAVDSLNGNEGGIVVEVTGLGDFAVRAVAEDADELGEGGGGGGG